MIVKMGKNHRVLKLVHPGGFVEIHQNSVRADEVMKKNPRHCVTRPDVFKFPWIVVRPESVLNIGLVFYIVPFHTLHRLMKRKKCPFDNSLLLQQQLIDSSPVEVTSFREIFEKPCLNTSQPRSKVDCKIDHWPEDTIFHKRLLENKQSPQSSHDQDSPVKSRLKLDLEGLDDSLWKALSDDHRYAAFEYRSYQESMQQTANHFCIEHAPSFSSDVASNDVHNGKTFPKVNDGLESNSYQQQNKVLKSCLKKENNGRSRGFRVRFLIPEESDEKINIEVLTFQPRKSS